jgi:hypothetical protein
VAVEGDPGVLVRLTALLETPNPDFEIVLP